MTEEIWKDIPGYEGMYQVSNLGRVKSLGRMVDYHHNMAYRAERILKPNKVRNYYQISLQKGGTRRYLKVHRIVATTFIPNPHNHPYINHKDENKLNNCVENLEWCDEGYNTNYGTRNAKVSVAMTNGKLAKIVYQYDLSGRLIKTWASTQECGRNGMSRGCISDCCRGVKKSYRGFIWSYIKL